MIVRVPKIKVSFAQVRSHHADEVKPPPWECEVVMAINTTDYEIGKRMSKAEVDRMINEGVSVNVTAPK